MVVSRKKDGWGKEHLISQSWLFNSVGLKAMDLDLGLWVWRWPQCGEGVEGKWEREEVTYTYCAKVAWKQRRLTDCFSGTRLGFGDGGRLGDGRWKWKVISVAMVVCEQSFTFKPNSYSVVIPLEEIGTPDSPNIVSLYSKVNGWALIFLSKKAMWFSYFK